MSPLRAPPRGRILARTMKQQRLNDLETCLMCGRDYVNPVDWEPVEGDHWWMLLRCGECHTWREVTVSDDVAQRFDGELNRRIDVLAGALSKLDRQHMTAWAESFVLALRSGLLDAADFAR
jgi:hypothetical protein